MKKAFLLASILFISVISTACINNFAVQELNNKAKEFMDKGDYVSAIERLKSSVDLDEGIFETQYNLAVAYTKAEDYQNAIKTYGDAIDLNPDFADVYYSRAVCEENLAKDVISGAVLVKDDGSCEKNDAEEKTVSEMSDNQKKFVSELLANAIEDYKIYLDKSSDSNEEIENKIKELENLAESHK